MQKLTNDQFAIFAANLILEIKQYNFDLFYDISKITEVIKEDKKEPLIWLIRETGSYLIPESNKDFLSAAKSAFSNKKIIRIIPSKEDGIHISELTKEQLTVIINEENV